ncbi:hypothetical protein VNO78_11055 [Psophocarpus tetragonolobus]|uniref:Uncharacterized protein n=1 Tax=Psophocarpus tetragonolobus TaxID=3891 RepID=A0AAN9SNI1_PSOTE
MGMNLMLLKSDDSKDILEYINVNLKWVLTSPFGEFVRMDESMERRERYDVARFVVSTSSKEVINFDELLYEIKI